MTTYIRPAAVARDDADMIAGWNISPNTGYQLQLSATPSGVVVILLSANGSTLLGSGTASIGAAQPVTITPMSGQTVDMADAALGWHMLLTTDGTEGDRTITMDAMVDLSARTHPVYADDDLALAVGTADINAGTHYTQDVTASCPLGFAASVGDTASVPVDDVTVVGQVESITWSGTPDGTGASVVIREHIQIRPDAYVVPVPPTPPTVADDTGTTDAATATSGNVLTNDEAGLVVVAVNGLAANVGVAVDGSDGGVFVIAADGAWTFDPDGDFAALTGSETADTSLTYHASDGVSEAMATLTVTVTVSAGDVYDEHWSYVTCLVQPESGVITDALGSAITLYGSPSVYGDMIALDGIDDCLLVADSTAVDIPAGQFTVDFYFRATALPASAASLVTKGFNVNVTYVSFSIIFDNTGTLLTEINSSSASHSNHKILTSAKGAVSIDTDYHIEYSRDASNLLRLFMNGNLVNSGTSSVTPYNSSDGLRIGHSLVSGKRSLFLQGLISPVRITKGICRHTSNFVPPTSPFPTA